MFSRLLARTNNNKSGDDLMIFCAMKLFNRTTLSKKGSEPSNYSNIYSHLKNLISGK